MTPPIYYVDQCDPELINKFQEQWQQVPIVTIDCETNGSRDPVSGKLTLVGIGIPAKSGFQCWVFDINAEQKLLKQLAPLLESVEVLKVGHNLLFDWKFLRRNSASEYLQPTFDTSIASKLLYNGRQNLRHSLKDCVQRELNLEMNKDPNVQISFHGGPYSREQLQYLSDDLVAPFLLVKPLQKKLQQENMLMLTSLENLCFHSFAEMSLTGFLIDQEARGRLEEQLSDELEQERSKLPKVRKKDGGEVELNFNSPKQIKEYFASVFGLNLPNTSESTLSGIRQNKAQDLAQVILHCKALSKQNGTFVAKMRLQNLHEDGRIRSSFDPLGTTSGRSTASGPNVQQVPSDPEYRSLYTAGPDNVLVICDYGQIELRVAAELAGESQMIEAMCRGEDLHALTASECFQVPVAEVTKEQRSKAKAINFALIYAAGPKSLMEEGAAETIAQAKAIRSSFFRAYPNLSQFHRNLTRQAEKDFNRETKLGKMKTPGSNRLHWFPQQDLYYDNGPIRKATVYNRPVQGCAADGMKVALVCLHKKLEGTGAKLVSMVHDEVIVECPAQVAEQVRQIVEQSMLDGMKTFVHDVPVVAEASICHSWAEK